MTRYNDPPQIAPSSDRCSGDFKYFFSFFVEIKLFCTVVTNNFDLRKICVGGFLIALFLFCFRQRMYSCGASAFRHRFVSPPSLETRL